MFQFEQSIKKISLYYFLFILVLAAVGVGVFERYRPRDYESALKHAFHEEIEEIQRQMNRGVIPFLVPSSSSIVLLQKRLIVTFIEQFNLAKSPLFTQRITVDHLVENNSLSKLSAAYLGDIQTVALEERELQSAMWNGNFELPLEFARLHVSRAEGWINSGKKEYALVHLLGALRFSHEATFQGLRHGHLVEAIFIGGKAIDLLFGRRRMIREVARLSNKSIWSTQASRISPNSSGL